MSIIVRENGEELILGTNPDNKLKKASEWLDADVASQDAPIVTAYEIEFGFDEEFDVSETKVYDIKLNTEVVQGNAPTVDYIGSAGRVDSLIDEGY